MTLAALSDDLPEDGTEVEVDSSEAVVEEVGNGPEADLQEVASLDAEIGSAEVVIDEAADGAEALDDIAGAVDEANKEGGLDAPAAEAIRIAVEHISRRAGLVVPARFAVEGFKSKTSRVQAGRMASESIKEQAKKIWDMIVKMYEKVKAWVIKWFNNFFDGATKLKNRAEKLVKAAEAKVTAGDKVDAKKLNIVAPAYAERLATGKGVSTPESLEKAYADGSLIKAGIEIAAAAKIQEELTGVIEGVNEEGRFKSAAETIYKSVEALARSGKAVSDKKLGAGEGVQTYELTGDLPGGKALYVNVPKAAGENVAESISKIKFFLGNVIGSAALVKADMQALQPEQAKAVAAGVAKAADGLIQGKKDVAAFQKSFDNVNATAKRLASATKDDAKDRARQAAKIAKAVLSVTTQGIVAARSHEISTHGAALAYVAASLSLAGKTEAAPAAA
jgi:hypothetical protein